METMRLLSLLLTIWTTAAGSACAQQPLTDHPLWKRSPPPPPPPPPAPLLATLDLRDLSQYGDFIDKMRKVFSEKDASACSMKKMSETTPFPRYGYINIIASGTKTITLAMDRTNIYVTGYRDKINGKDRAFFFDDEFNNARDLFPEATGNNRYKLPYTGSYGSLGNKRDKVPLGFQELKISIDNIYGKQSGKNDFTKHQKTFFVIAIQMIAEAARFKHISEKIEKGISFTPDARMRALENGWGYLSTAVYMQTKPSKNTLTKCELKENVVVQLIVEGESPWIFKSVEAIADVVGLLKAKGKNLSINNDNDDNTDDFGGGGVVASS